MSDKSISYTSKAISADILSVLDIVADGKVVSATAWNTLWNAVFNSINSIDTYCMTINNITVDWANSKAELEQTISEFNRKHDALLNSFVHCGDEPPVNEHVRFWLKEVEETSPLATKADVAVVAAEVAHKADKDSLVGAATETQGEIFNDYETNIASGLHSHAEGNETVASGKYSHAEGYRNEANAEGSHAEGRRNKITSTGKGSHIEGCDGEVSSSYSHVEGYGCKVTADRAHAECSENQATGYAAHAEGSGTIASGAYTHTEGFKTEAKVDGAHSEGKFTKAESTAAHAEGNETTASGRYAHAEGSNTTASGESAHAEGHTSAATADATHAEGVGTQALSYGAHAEGSGTQALGQFTHAEGLNTVAQANNAHAEGNETQATGSSAHAEGYQTVASGAHSHAAGTGTIATYNSQTVVGAYNKESNALFIVGNGTSDTERSNAFTVLKDGSVSFAGQVISPAHWPTILAGTPVDAHFNHKSPNAQSGIAVAEAVNKPWQLIYGTTLSEPITQLQINKEQYPEFKEIHIEARILPTDKTLTTQNVYITVEGYNLWHGKGSPKATGTIYLMADIYLTPDNGIVCSGNMSDYFWTKGESNYTSFGYYHLDETRNYYTIDEASSFIRLRTETVDGMGVGTKIRIWGR